LGKWTFIFIVHLLYALGVLICRQHKFPANIEQTVSQLRLLNAVSHTGDVLLVIGAAYEAAGFLIEPISAICQVAGWNDTTTVLIIATP
jgi:hypothetical protein